VIGAGPLTQADASNDCRFTQGNMATTFPRVNVEPHQCMLVELSGAGLLFTTSSVVRNMDFVLNSKDVRAATISVEGLKPINSGLRDVYLAVEKVNMPEKTQQDTGFFSPVFGADRGINIAAKASHDLGAVATNQNPEDFNVKVATARAYIEQRFDSGKLKTPDQRLTLMLEALREAGANSNDLDRLFPTYRVHTYYDSGDTWTVDGKTYALLGLQPSFGFYAYHEGQLLGYNAQLRGAIRLTKNVYLLPVPNNGSAKVTTIIHGISPGEESQVEPEEPIQGWPKTKKPGCLARLLALIGIKL
jgi:hypothetical protein